MNLFSRLKAAFKAEKQSTGSSKWMQATTTVTQAGDSKRPDFDPRNAVAYYRSWIYAAASINAIAVASVPLRLYVRSNPTLKSLWSTRAPSRRTKAYLAGDLEQRPSRFAMRKAAEYGEGFEEVTEMHPVTKLLSKVNPYQNGYDATVLRVLYTELCGNAYLNVVKDQALGIPVELYPMPPQFVEIVPGETKFIEAYRYGVKSDSRKTFAPEEVLHFKRPNPSNLYYGLGKVEAAWGAAMMNAAVHEMDLAFFENRGRPDYLMTVKSDAGPEEIARLTAEVEEKLRGRSRNGRFLTATADIDVKPLSFPPKDLSGRDEIVEEIAAVFGVPVSMLKANDPNLASAQTGYAQWREMTILPMLRMDEEVLNQSLLPMFGLEDDAFLAYDNPVQEDKRFEMEERRTAVAGGWRTVNEARKEEGREPIEDEFADRLLFNGQPLGGAAAMPPAAPSPFGLASADPAKHEQPAQDAAHAWGIDVEAQEPNAKDALSDCVSSKIPKLIDEGYPQDQAVAIAYSMCSGKSLEDAVAELERKELEQDASPSVKAISDIDTRPPQTVADNARRALEVRARKPESERGMTAVGLARARDLQNRVALSEDTIRRMLAYFERHESDKQGETWDDQGKGWQAWNGWGGDDGFAWARRKVEQFDREREKRVGSRRVRKSCGCGCSDGSEKVSVKRLWSDHVVTKAVGDASEEEQRIASAVDKVLQRQIREAIKAIRESTAPTQELTVKVETLLMSAKWNREIVDAMRPYLQSAIREGLIVGNRTVQEVAALAPEFAPPTPELDAYVEAESTRLARRAAGSVNRYTAVRVSALLGDGLQAGATIDELADGVQEWAGRAGDDDRATRNRAVTIARTEAQRAMRSAEVEAWRSSGIVEGKTWLLAPDPCEFCQAMADQFEKNAVGIDQAFLTRGSVLTGADGGELELDYENIDGPPLHPNCRCSLQPKLVDGYQDIASEIQAEIEREERAAREAQ